LHTYRSTKWPKALLWHNFDKISQTSNSFRYNAHTPTNTIPAFENGHLRAMLQQNFRTSQAGDTRSDYADMRYLARDSSNHWGDGFVH
jgi:hypothetical protein